GGAAGLAYAGPAAVFECAWRHARCKKQHALLYSRPQGRAGTGRAAHRRSRVKVPHSPATVTVRSPGGWKVRLHERWGRVRTGNTVRRAVLPPGGRGHLPDPKRRGSGGDAPIFPRPFARCRRARTFFAARFLPPGTGREKRSVTQWKTRKTQDPAAERSCGASSP